MEEQMYYLFVLGNNRFKRMVEKMKKIFKKTIE